MEFEFFLDQINGGEFEFFKKITVLASILALILAEYAQVEASKLNISTLIPSIQQHLVHV